MTESFIASGSTIGILGGGQLGRMLAIAAAEMGYRTHVYCPEKDAPAFDVSGTHTVAAYDNKQTLTIFAQSVDVITYEFENISAKPLAVLGEKLQPSLELLGIAQHRVQEKQKVGELGVATAPFAPVDSLDSLKAAVEKIGLPAVLKTCRMGYDGKGQIKLDTKSDLAKAWQELATDEAILEGFVDFRMEISVIVARNAQGEMVCYPPVQNIHKNHILAETIAPAPIDNALSDKAEKIARQLAEGLQLVGVMAVEMFVTRDDALLVNELAPRPHNSGHWTIDACVTSQFEQAVRAICGLPLGSTRRLCDARMLNLIGDEINDWQKHIASPDARVHIYGKKETRPGRKMGHVTFLEKP